MRANRFRNEAVRTGREQMGVKQQRHRPRAIVRGDRAVERGGEMRDALRFSQAANPGDIEIGDIDSAANKHLAIPR